MDWSFLLPLSCSNDQEDGRHGPWTHVYFLNNCILKARTSQSFFFVSLFPFSLFLIFQEYGIWGHPGSCPSSIPPPHPPPLTHFQAHLPSPNSLSSRCSHSPCPLFLHLDLKGVSLSPAYTTVSWMSTRSAVWPPMIASVLDI